MRPIKPVLMTILGAVLLAGCIDTVETAATEPAPIISDPNSPAVRACRSAIARAAGISERDVAVYDAPGSEAGTRVLATIAGGTAPWSCISDNRGNVAQVMSMADEGAL